MSLRRPCLSCRCGAWHHACASAAPGSSKGSLAHCANTGSWAPLWYCRSLRPSLPALQRLAGARPSPSLANCSDRGPGIRDFIFVISKGRPSRWAQPDFYSWLDAALIAILRLRMRQSQCVAWPWADWPYPQSSLVRPWPSVTSSLHLAASDDHILSPYAS